MYTPASTVPSASRKMLASVTPAAQAPNSVTRPFELTLAEPASGPDEPSDAVKLPDVIVPALLMVSVKRAQSGSLKALVSEKRIQSHVPAIAAVVKPLPCLRATSKFR